MSLDHYVPNFGLSLKENFFYFQEKFMDWRLMDFPNEKTSSFSIFTDSYFRKNLWDSFLLKKTKGIDLEKRYALCCRFSPRLRKEGKRIFGNFFQIKS